MSDVVVASREFMHASDRLTTLWSLSEEFENLVALLEDPDADPEAIDREMQRVAGDIKTKAFGVASVVNALEGLAAFQKMNADRLVAKAKANQAHADRLRSYALSCLQALGIERLETGQYTLVVRTNPPRVEVTDAAAIPTEFQRTKIIQEVDKQAILSTYKAGGEIPPGCEVTRGQRLELR